MRISSSRGIYIVYVASLAAFIMTLLLVKGYLLFHEEYDREDADIKEILISKGSRTEITSARRQLHYSDRECSKEDIEIYQGDAPPLASGIPAYTVQIMNICATDCYIGNIRLHCGWFSSASVINPTVFRRVEYDDCLVNDGQPLAPARVISFQYANTFPYPLSVASLDCLS